MGKYDDKSLAVDKKYIKRANSEFLERVYFYMIPTAQKRVAWLKKHEKLELLGEHVHWQPRKYPTDGKRLKIHDNVAIATDVEFILHDVIHWVFNGIEGKRSFIEYKGCIEVYDNVFIGAGSRILPNVSIGPNAIVSAGSLVTKDVAPGTIVGGVPAKVIGDFNEIQDRRKKYSEKMHDMSRSETDDYLWEAFYSRNKV